MKFVSRFIISTTSTVKINSPYYEILPAIELLRLCLYQIFCILTDSPWHLTCTVFFLPLP